MDRIPTSVLPFCLLNPKRKNRLNACKNSLSVSFKKKKGITMKLYNRQILVLLAAFLSSLLTGCMTIFTPSCETILINRSTSEPVTIVTASDTIVADGQPIELSVKKRHLNKPIQIASKEYTYQTLIPGRRTDWWGAFLDLFFGGDGLIVDYITGAIYHPRQKNYYVKAARKDTLHSELHVADYRAPSPFKAANYHSRHFRHELRLGVSIGNALHNDCYDRMSQRVANHFYQSSYEGDLDYGQDAVTNFAASLSYFYHFDEHLAVGMIAGTGGRPNAGYIEYDPDWEQSWHNHWHTNTPPEVYVGNMESTSWFFLPSVKYYWAFNPGTRFYSKAAFGLMSQHNWFESCDIHNNPYYVPKNAERPVLSERLWHIAGQLSPVGVEVGRRWLRFFVELGYGMEGIFNAGWSCYF